MGSLLGNAAGDFLVESHGVGIGRFGDCLEGVGIESGADVVSGGFRKLPIGDGQIAQQSVVVGEQFSVAFSQRGILAAGGTACFGQRTPGIRCRRGEGILFKQVLGDVEAEPGSNPEVAVEMEKCRGRRRSA